MKCDRAVIVFVLILTVLAATAAAQSSLTLAEAIARARHHNPDVGSAVAAQREAAERVTQARGGYFPKVDIAESWQRGNDPVFAFSSRLAQRQLTEADLGLDALNHPAAINNFRTGLSIEQLLFDRTTSAAVRTASIGVEMAATGTQLVDQELTVAVTGAFGRVLTTSAAMQSVAAAVDAARADRELATNRRSAGRATDADVLQVDLQLARALEQQAQVIADDRIARARLNRLMGEPLTAAFLLEPAPSHITIDVADPDRLEEEALKYRPEVALARQQEQLAAAAVDAARAAYWPRVAAQGTWQLNGGSWSAREPSWGAGVVATINVFRGFSDQGRIAEARQLAARRAIERGKAETMARLDVRTAIAQLEAARASEAAGQAATEWARENRRIIRDRYESGLADVAMLLRSADAVLQAESQRVAARVNVLTATATLQRAIGKP